METNPLSLLISNERSKLSMAAHAHHPHHEEVQYLDPHNQDNNGPVPPWRPDGRKRWKPGQSRAAYIWPRDKGVTSNPSHSWRRLKDVLTGKGPGIWIGDRRSFGPDRATWSNWQAFDNLGYRREPDEIAGLYAGPGNKRYDFYTRKYQVPTNHTWSDVKWERRRHPKYCFYHRDETGEEWCDLPTGDSGHPGPEGNMFRYRDNTRYFDWVRPRNNDFYYNRYLP